MADVPSETTKKELMRPPSQAPNITYISPHVGRQNWHVRGTRDKPNPQENKNNQSNSTLTSLTSPLSPPVPERPQEEEVHLVLLSEHIQDHKEWLSNYQDSKYPNRYMLFQIAHPKKSWRGTSSSRGLRSLRRRKASPRWPLTTPSCSVFMWTDWGNNQSDVPETIREPLQEVRLHWQHLHPQVLPGGVGWGNKMPELDDRCDYCQMVDHQRKPARSLYKVYSVLTRHRESPPSLNWVTKTTYSSAYRELPLLFWNNRLIVAVKQDVAWPT